MCCRDFGGAGVNRPDARLTPLLAERQEPGGRPLDERGHSSRRRAPTPGELGILPSLPSGHRCCSRGRVQSPPGHVSPGGGRHCRLRSAMPASAAEDPIVLWDGSDSFGVDEERVLVLWSGSARSTRERRPAPGQGPCWTGWHRSSSGGWRPQPSCGTGRTGEPQVVFCSPRTVESSSSSASPSGSESASASSARTGWRACLSMSFSAEESPRSS